MPSLKHTETANPTSLANTIIAKTGCLVFLCLFLFILYTQEKTVISYISDNLSTPDQFLINTYLHRLTGQLLPGQFWRLCWGLLIAAAGMIFFDRWRWYFIAAAGIFSALILIANMIYHDFFSAVITVSSLSVANHLPGVWSGIASMFRTRYIFMVLVFLVFIIVGLVFNKYHDASLNKNLPSFVIDKVVGIACALLAFYSFSIGFHLDTKEVLYKKINDQPRLFIFSRNDPASEKEKHDLIAPRYLTSPKGYALTFGMFNYYFKDMMDSFAGTPAAPLRNDAVERFAQLLDRKYQTNKISSPFAGTAASRNIFLIDLESLHPFLLDLSIGGTEVMPTLNNISKTALYWKYILDHTGRGSSSDAEFSIMNGLLPMYWKKKITAVEIPRTAKLITLPDTLKAFNYSTFSFHGYNANFWSRSINHPLWGIDSMFFKKSFQTDEQICFFPIGPYL